MWIDRIFKFREKSEMDVTKPFLEHLEDLRWTLARMGGTVALAMMLSFCFRHQLVDIIQHPLHQIDPHAQLRTLGITDSFTISIQIAFYSGLVLSFPFLLYFLAQFVLPALTLKEKKYVLPGIGIGFGLFLTGVMIAYFLILPKALGFFRGDTNSFQWNADWTATQYFSFVTQLTLVFGLAFELPVAVMALVYFGLLTFAFLNRTRAYAIVLILIIAMIIAPSPDVLTFFSLGAPMIILYEACIWLAWLMERRRKVN
jgi:sec-independent protein translocase protein TatC